jgi:hypothetical protein
MRMCRPPAMASEVPSSATTTISATEYSSVKEIETLVR